MKQKNRRFRTTRTNQEKRLPCLTWFVYPPALLPIACLPSLVSYWIIRPIRLPNTSTHLLRLTSPTQCPGIKHLLLLDPYIIYPLLLPKRLYFFHFCVSLPSLPHYSKITSLLTPSPYALLSSVMLLTLKPSQQHGLANPYAYSPAQRSPSSYYSSPPKSASLPPLPDSQPRRMSTPHRGLPPPSVMERNLPLPERAQPTNNLSLATLSAPLPAAPTTWQQDQGESMRIWLQARTEDDRRRQEEEKTRQEDLKLQQRKVEQNMLHESFQNNVPPPLIPMIFASIGGANVANISVELAQQYMAQLNIGHQQQLQQQQQAQLQLQQQQQQQQQQQAQQHLQSLPQPQSSPELRRDTRMITGPNPNPYGAQQMQPPVHNAVQLGQQPPQPSASITPSYTNASLAGDRLRNPQPLQAAPPTSNPRLPTSRSALSHLNTGDMHQTAPPGNTALHLSGQHPLQQAQVTQNQDQPSSPGLYFHHWQPPESQGKSKDKDGQGTPAGKSHNTSPNTQPPGSHLRSEYTTSPKKRKATGAHQAAPTPSSHTSPSFSHQGSSGSTSGRRRRHSRASDTSSHSHSRPAQESGRQSFSEVDSGRNSAHPETRHAPPHPSAGSDSREMREIRHVSRDLSERSSPKREA